MAVSRIEWTERTWNPIGGCRKISPGCQNCYAIREAHRMVGHPNERIRSRYAGLTRIEGAAGNWTGATFIDENILAEPLRRRKRTRYFISLSDLFFSGREHDDVDRVLCVMEQCHWHTFQALTKYHTAMEHVLRERYGGGVAPRNIWWGVSVENQQYADLRIPSLLRTPAALRFISAEPLLGPVDLSPWIRSLDWVIVGGESGPRARPMHRDWARSIRDQCLGAGVPFFFKQWGDWLPERQAGLDGDTPCAMHPDCRDWGVLTGDGQFSTKATKWMDLPGHYTDASEAYVYRLGKRNTGRLLDRRTWDEKPQNAWALE